MAGLARVLRMRDLFSLLFGTIVGVGWIAASGGWIAQAGPVGAIVAFAGGAVVMTMIGLCYGEVMAALPEASGAVGYALFAFGERMAFATGWFLTLTYATSIAFFVVTVSWLVEAVAGPAMGPVLYTVFGSGVHAGPTAIAAVLAVALAFANQRGTETAAGLQNVAVVMKIFLAVLLGLAACANGRSAHLVPLLGSDTGWHRPLAIGAVMVTTPFWFAGFDVLPQAIRERRGDLDLSRLGRLIAGTIGAALLFYGMVIFAASSLLPRPELLAAGLPTFHAFRAGLGVPALAQAVIVLGIIGLVTSWNATLFSAARVLQALGAARLLPRWVGVRHPRLATPARAVWMMTAIGMGLGLAGPNAVNTLLEAASISIVVTFIVLCAGLLRMRRRSPGRIGPYRVPGAWFARLAIVLSIGLLGLSIADPIAGPGPFRVPAAWLIVIIWSVLGLVSWRLDVGRRDSMTSAERAAVLVGSD